MKPQFTASPKLYISMDIHKKSWSIHLRTDISDYKSMTIPAKAEVLEAYVNENFHQHEVHLVYESGCYGFGAAHYFLNLGWNVKVVNPADIPTMNKQAYQKTDAIDCRNLSKQLQADQLRDIFIPDEQQDYLKSLVRQRATISKQLRSTKNGIKSLLLYHGHTIPAEYDNPNWSKALISWIASISWKAITVKICMQSKLRTLDFLQSESLSLANVLRSYCRKQFKTDYYLLKSVPAVGGYLASAILGEIGDLRRFNKATDFASYVGIIPMMRNSGGTEKVVGVTPRCRALLRSYIIESSWVAFRLDPYMQSYYRKHVGRNPKSIVVKIAHKLLNRMLAVIKTGKPYEKNYALNDGVENTGTRKQTAKQAWVV